VIKKDFTKLLSQDDTAVVLNNRHSEPWLPLANVVGVVDPWHGHMAN
jgi:hypothetical protein